MIKPVLETWLIERAEANKISLKKYNLPVKRKEVHNVKRYDLNNNYQKFLSQLIEQDNEIKVVQEWLKKKNFIK
ncbi:MAG: hypothetical protein U9O87_10195 [Verrucomicrobiota bacterium]|nr:hypothetical protein [Verrucomicrobiota bacterium]